jgi:DNA-binding transcriptional MerR regulator
VSEERTLLQIGEVAERVGLSLDEIRELAELIEQSARPGEQAERTLEQPLEKLGSCAARTGAE